MFQHFLKLFTKKRSSHDSDPNAETIKKLDNNEKLLLEIKNSFIQTQQQLTNLSNSNDDNFSQLPKKRSTTQTISNWIFTIAMTIISLFTAYISIETYIQVKKNTYEKLNSTWIVDHQMTKTNTFQSLRIGTEEDFNDADILPYEISIELGLMSHLTGEMTIIDHHKKEIIYLFVKANEFELTNIFTASKLNLWEFIKGIPTTKDFGLNIQPINEQSMTVSGFNVINNAFDLALPNTIIFTNNKEKQNITDISHDNYESQVTDLFCFNANILKPSYMSQKNFKGLQYIGNYCFNDTIP